MNVFLGILLILFGAVVGGFIVLKCLDKTVEDLMDSYESLNKTYENILYLDNKIIACKDKIIQDTYRYLVKLRDSDIGNLDTIIGELGGILDNHYGEEETDGPDSD